MAVKSDLPVSEYDDRDEPTLQAETYSQLEWLRYELKRKAGWTAVTFKELFGAWPLRWMKTLTPINPGKEFRSFVKRRDNAFKRELKKAKANANA